MSAELHNIGDGNGDRARRLISELLSGELDDEAFVRAVAESYRNDPDVPWEMLALIDRYHRLGQLPTDRFRVIKTRIEELALGRKTASGPATRPTPPGGEYTQEIRAHPRAAPTTTPPPTTALPPTTAQSPATAQPPTAATPRGPAASASSSPLVGEMLRGRYELQSVLGRGGMGTVYEALDRTRAGLGLGRAHVAVKVLHPEHARRPELVAVFAREFDFTQGLSHPNVVNVHEIDHRGETVFFTMELLQGAHLSQIIARTAERALPRPQVLAIVRDVGAALAHAHARGVVHGDLKPHNIMVTDDGEVRVLDFGAACDVTHEPWISEFSPGGEFRAATPAYASCQVLEGARPEPADDLYALACVAYVLLTGEHPFGGKSAKEARMLKLRPARPAGVRASAWAMLSAALSWSRERRPNDVNAWLARLDLGEAAARLPPQSLLVSAPRRSAPWAAITAAVAAVLAVATLIGVLGPRAARSTLIAAADQAAGGAAVSLQRLRQRIGPAPNFTAGADSSRVPPPAPAAAAAAAVAVQPPLGFASETYTVGPNDVAARILIRRSGAPGRALDFVWWTEAASAKPGVDYASLGRRHERMAVGQETLTVYVPIVGGARRHNSATFYVALNAPDGDSGAAAEQRATVIVTRKRS